MRLFKSRLGIILILIAVVLIAAGTGGFSLTTYRRSQYEFTVEGASLNVHTPYGSTEKWAVKKNFGSILNAWDPDESEWGMPNLGVTFGNVRFQNSSKPIEKYPYKNWTYIVEYQEYIFDVQIRTVADVVKYGNVFGQGLTWHHETSMPYEFRTQVLSGGTHIGKDVTGTLYPRIIFMPIGIPDLKYDLPENWTYTDNFWVGVWDARIQDSKGDVIDPNIPRSFPGAAENLLPVNAHPTLYNEAESIYTNIENPLDPDVLNVVKLALPFKLKAGAYMKYNPTWGSPFGGGSIEEVQAINYYAQYTVCLECFVVRESQERGLVLGGDQGGLEPPTDVVHFTTRSWWDIFMDYFWQILIILIVLFVLVLIFAPWLIAALFSMILGSRSRYVTLTSPLSLHLRYRRWDSG